MAHETVALWAEVVDDDKGPFTAEELARLPDDGYHYELLEGRLLRMPTPGTMHGRWSSRIDFAVRQFVQQHRLGEVFTGDAGFLLSPSCTRDIVLGPDVAFVRADRLPPPESPEWEPYLRLAPDLVVEIASPSQFRPEMEAKAREWLAAGTRLLWLVWPARQSVDVWRPQTRVLTLGPHDTIDGFDVLPGLRLPMADIFAP